MLSEKMVTLGTKKSVIREIFEYSKKRAVRKMFSISASEIQTSRLRFPFMRQSKNCLIPGMTTICSVTLPHREMPTPALPLQRT